MNKADNQQPKSAEAPVAQPAATAKPVAAAAKPAATVKPVTAAAKPAEPAKPAAAAAKPAEPAKPVAAAAKPAEPAKPAATAAKPAEPAKPTATAAKPAAAKPAVAVAKPAATAKPATPAAKSAEPATPVKSGFVTKLRGFGCRACGLVQRNRLLMAVVLLPLLLAIVYFGLLAKDRYVSESMVVVKRADDMNIGNLSLGSLLGGGSASTKEDALLLQQYIMSPDMLQKLDERLDFKTAFANSGWDVLQRLPKKASFEDYLAYYQAKVAVVFDEKNAVLSITTQGFTPAFAQQFNQAVLAESERFINELSHKINREEMLFANQEINRAYGQLQEAKETLLAFQNDNNLVDPQVQIEATSRIVAELQTKQAQLEAELTNQLTYLNDDTPQIKASRSAIDSIKQQIEKERATLTSSDNEQLNQKMFEFEELKAKVAFEGDLYKLSLTTLEKSRIEAARKAKSLATISQPYLAEDARYPRRLYMLLTVLLVSLLVYGLSKVTLSIIEDHKI